MEATRWEENSDGSSDSLLGALAPPRVVGAEDLLLSSSDEDGAFPRMRGRPKVVTGARSRFIVGEKLGEGAYGTVKEGIDETSMRIVAIKIVDLRRLRKVRGGVEGIEREVAVQKKLKRHANLIELVDVVRDAAKSKMYIILEMANGCSVQELAEAAPGGRVPESQVANLVFQTLTGLQTMHGRGIVHRDIKPANLMLTSAGGLKISDFGVAEFLDGFKSDDSVSRTSGSPAFQAPEIAKGEQDYSGMKVDVWALGVTVFYLVTGDIPFKGDNLIALFDSISTGSYVTPDMLQPDCVDVLSHMLEVDWRKRWSVDELLKHPWVARGSRSLSPEQREKDNWVPVPRKEFGILNVVKRMYDIDEPAQPSAEPPSTPRTARASPTEGTGVWHNWLLGGDAPDSDAPRASGSSARPAPVAEPQTQPQAAPAPASSDCVLM